MTEHSNVEPDRFYFTRMWKVRLPDGRTVEYAENVDAGPSFSEARGNHEHALAGLWVEPSMVAASVGGLRGYRQHTRTNGKIVRVNDRELDGHGGRDIRTIPTAPTSGDLPDLPEDVDGKLDELRFLVDDDRWQQIGATVQHLRETAGAAGPEIVSSYLGTCLVTGGGKGDPVPSRPREWWDDDHEDEPLPVEVSTAAPPARRYDPE